MDSERGSVNNFDKPPIELETFDYEREPEPGASRYPHCPVCKVGFLMGRRQSEPPFLLLHEDNCINCGQRVIYKSLGIWEESNRVFLVWEESNRVFLERFKKEVE